MKHIDFNLCILITSSCSFLCLGQTTLDGLKVLQLKFCINDFLIANGVDGAIYVGDIIILETAQDMDDGIRLTNVAKELVS